MIKTILSGTLLALLLISPAILQAEAPPTGSGQVPVLPQVQTYDQLVAAIRQARAASQSRVEQAVQQEKVREAWETGKLIDEHILHQKERAEYGKQVILRLAQDLGTSQTELSFMLQFARAYPIHSPANELSWAHYRELLALNDVKEQDEIAEKAEKGKWTRDQVREEVKALKGTGSSAEDGVPVPLEKPLTAKPGRPYTYRIVPGLKAGEVVIDLGFSTYYTPPEISLKAYKAGDIVRGDWLHFQKEEQAPFPVEKVPVPEKMVPVPLSENDLYTYTATVTEVIDGDTIWAVLDLGFGIRTKLRLRLNHIDAPEIVSVEGKESKTYLEKLIGRFSGTVTVKSSKLDNYGRYLIDLFVPKTRDQTLPTGRHGQATRDYIYVNQELLSQGLAVRMEE